MNANTSVWLNDFATAWASWMLGMTWLVAALVAVLALITMLLRKRSASVLYALWLLVLVRLILPPDFALPTGWGWWFRTEMPTVTSPVPANTSYQEGTVSTGISPGRELGTDLAKPAASATVPLALILMIAWLGIVAARCGMLFTAALQVHVWVSRAQLILDPKLLTLLDECRDRVGVRRRVELRNSESCSTPLVVGIWRPVLLLPSAVIGRLTPDQLQSVLIHELYHVRRWDGLVNLLQGLLGAAYFFNPAVWWANRRIRQLREDACDERTVAVLAGNRKPYGEAIFHIAEILGYSAPPLTLGVLDSTSPLTQRLRRILDPSLPIDGVQPWKSAALLFIASAILLPAGAKPSVSDASPRSEPRIVVETFSGSPLEMAEKEQVPVSPFGPQTLEEDAPLDDTISEQDRESSPTTNHEQIADLVHDLAAATRRQAAVDALITLGPTTERELLMGLPARDPGTRAVIYEVLANVGTEKSVLALQQALLMRNGMEERQIRRALDAIYDRIVIRSLDNTPSMNSSRVYESEDEDEWNEHILVPLD